MEQPPERSRDQLGQERATAPEIGGSGDGTLAGKEWMSRFLRRFPDGLDGVNLEELEPDLFPMDRVLAEVIIHRDRLRGIEHPEMISKLTARW